MTNNVGILAVEVYFPSTYVSQTELEKANGVSSGKYTIGLGQDAMAFTGDREDINSISLSVVQSLLDKYDIEKDKIGRIEVGTESLVDKSKSTKTVLMSLFDGSGNTDIEGATVINACYGGTSALLNALLWVDSSSWDGRYAIVVAADIAVYADGPARPTGGCGAVAMLVGRDAVLRIDLHTRTTYASHVWDFFKPNMDSEYPEVNGALSQTCYLRALDTCYRGFQKKVSKVRKESVNSKTIQNFLFHSPYNKLVQKSFARIIFSDILADVLPAGSISKWMSKNLEETYEDRELEMQLRDISLPKYNEIVAPNCELSKQIGNTYTASVYMNLANMISNHGATLVGQKTVLFSYGSGALATMFAIEAVAASSISPKFSLEFIQRALDIPNRLANRIKKTPDSLSHALQQRENSHGFTPFYPSQAIDELIPGTYYLVEIAVNFERNYQRKSLNGGSNMSTEDDDEGSGVVGLDLAGSGNGNSVVDVKSADSAPLVSSFKSLSTKSLASNVSFDSTVVNVDSPIKYFRTGNASGLAGLGDNPRSGMPRSETVVWASGRQRVNIVVTGVSAVLPGASTGLDGINKLIAGENFIQPLPATVIEAMLNKNVVMLLKGKDGSQVRSPVDSPAIGIKLSTPIGEPDLTRYGIASSIAGTMDSAVRVSVAAGMEALIDAGMISEQTKWELPEHMRDTTGIVYATSFPALDAAVAEVTRYFTSKIDNTTVADALIMLKSKLTSTYGPLSIESESAISSLIESVTEIQRNSTAVVTAPAPYEFDRKFLLRVLVLGNAQLAQIIKARGPNLQSNAACAGSTQAVALAYDMIQLGRAERMVVIAGDNASSATLMPWLGNGFRAFGAATTCGDVRLAALPFDSRRSGMILGSGGVGLVFESEHGARRRYEQAQIVSPVVRDGPFKCRLIATLISNSAYHGASMDRKHITIEMERFISSIETEHGISRAELARNGVYLSHETCTHATPSASCSYNEVEALRAVFKDELPNLLILNTKGYTGHAMGVSFEDVVAVEVLRTGQVPPMPNDSKADPFLGPGLKLSRGGYYPCKYALRFAAGFGSQVALALYGTVDVTM